MELTGLRHACRVALVGAVILLAGMQAASVGASPDDPLAGTWRGFGGPGAALRVHVSAPNAWGKRQVSFSSRDGENADPGFSCKAHGSGVAETNTSSGYYLLSGTWTVRCRGAGTTEASFGLLRPFAVELLFLGSDSLQRA